MDYPARYEFRVEKIFGKQGIAITLYSGLTTFIGPNASGKTQTLKALRDTLKAKPYNFKVRFLSSNRIGAMEQYRSKIDRFDPRSSDQFSIGDQASKKARHHIEVATGDFYTMDERKDIYIKVAERLSVFFDRQIYIRWDAGNMKVFFEKTESDEEYSVVAEASGLINIISILAALYDEEIDVLLIDEPEVSLHPQFQSYLLREIHKAIRQYGKTVVLSTHSTEMIEFNTPSDLQSLIFFDEDKVMPIQVPPDDPEIESRKLKDFLLRVGQLYKTGFFAPRVLFVEGTSDLIVCRYLAQRLNLNLDVAGTQIIPVDGKGQFSVITKLFRLIGKEVSVLTDLDGFIDDNSIVDLFVQLPEAIQKANGMGFENLSETNRLIKQKIRSLCEEHRDDMRPIYEVHPYWACKESSSDEIVSIKRAVIATLFSFEDEALENWEDADEWRSLKSRITALFNALETVGCFVLRKGTIEGYYQFPQTGSSVGKPSAAAEEVSQLSEQDDTFIRDGYSDVVRALEYSVLGKDVDESSAVRRELLSELALVLEVLPNVENDQEIFSYIKRTKGNSSTLFTYKRMQDKGKIGVTVGLNIAILDVTGFPFEIFCGDNVNDVVDDKIHRIM